MLNIKAFLPPARHIEYIVEAKAIQENISSFFGSGVSGGQTIVEARFGLRHFNLEDRNPSMAEVDGLIIESLKQRWKLLYTLKG